MLSDAKAIRLWLVVTIAHEETGRNGAMGSAADRDLLSRCMSRQACFLVFLQQALVLFCCFYEGNDRMLMALSVHQ